MTFLSKIWQLYRNNKIRIKCDGVTGTCATCRHTLIYGLRGSEGRSDCGWLFTNYCNELRGTPGIISSKYKPCKVERLERVPWQSCPQWCVYPVGCVGRASSGQRGNVVMIWGGNDRGVKWLEIISPDCAGGVDCPGQYGQFSGCAPPSLSSHLDILPAYCCSRRVSQL